MLVQYFVNQISVPFKCYTYPPNMVAILGCEWDFPDPWERSAFRATVSTFSSVIYVRQISRCPLHSTAPLLPYSYIDMAHFGAPPGGLARMWSSTNHVIYVQYTLTNTDCASISSHGPSSENRCI